MGAMGGIGMLSAGLLGIPGIGYKQDYFATDHLKNDANAAEKAIDTYERYKADEPNSFLFFPKITGLNNAKKEIILDTKDDKPAPGTALSETIEKLTKSNKLADNKEVVGAAILVGIGESVC